MQYRFPNLFFWREPSDAWSANDIVQCFVLFLVVFELYSRISYVFFDICVRRRVTAGVRLRYQRDWADYSFLVINRVLTYVFVLHCARWTLTDKSQTEPSLTSVAAPLPLLFLGYDLVYAPVHYFAHAWPAAYALIHKHHHRSVAPFRGVDDAINTSPLEYAFGMWLHLWVVLAARAVGLRVHPSALFIFVAVAAILAAANHTRAEIDIPYLFNSNEHDTHHRFSKHNYAQYTQFWDRCVGSFKAWVPPPATIARESPKGDALLSRQSAAKLKDAPQTCVVTGGSGLVGLRLVEMLIERGAKRVVSLDKTAPSADIIATAAPGVSFIVADICDEAALKKAFKGAVAVFHVAALVGPGFPKSEYKRVNVEGTRAVISAARSAGVEALVYTSSPTTRLDGLDVRGDAVDYRAAQPRDRQLQEYSATKAEGEAIALAASCSYLRVCAIAPHQVYGAADRLFLPSIIRAAASGFLRVFGSGDNLIAFTHVDNAAHAHILAAAALLKGTPLVAGEFFIVTDTGAQYLWDSLDEAITRCGLPSLETFAHVPETPLYAVAHTVAAVAPFCMRRAPQFSPFSVRMLTMDRWFDTSKIRTRLGYKPLVAFQDAWPVAVDAVRARLEVEGSLPTSTTKVTLPKTSPGSPSSSRRRASVTH